MFTAIQTVATVLIVIVGFGIGVWQAWHAGVDQGSRRSTIGTPLRSHLAVIGLIVIALSPTMPATPGARRSSPSSSGAPGCG